MESATTITAVPAASVSTAVTAPAQTVVGLSRPGRPLPARSHLPRRFPPRALPRSLPLPSQGVPRTTATLPARLTVMTVSLRSPNQRQKVVVPRPVIFRRKNVEISYCSKNASCSSSSKCYETKGKEMEL